MNDVIDKMTGGCLCRAVRFVARNVPTTFGICHCESCRRWTGSALFEVSVKTDDLTWSGAEHIATRATSDWAERAWCKECGTNLYFRQTKEGEWFGGTDLPMGLFDDPDGFSLTHEIFVDHKPSGIPLQDCGQKRLTRDEVVALNPDVGTT
ncbi:GFA family protein [Tateyamaria omphalii]|uniref:GFA family protein n=1 Tax=Tateyamaria omphalii TaxID=299262 RepID=UPI001C992F80|nr:GFA family protein [Tateyamaria omphalii]MBY5933562.1 GFA family protein [Tateyamaria omphalii]